LKSGCYARLHRKPQYLIHRRKQTNATIYSLTLKPCTEVVTVIFANSRLYANSICQDCEKLIHFQPLLVLDPRQVDIVSVLFLYVIAASTTIAVVPLSKFDRYSSLSRGYMCTIRLRYATIISTCQSIINPYSY